MSQMLAEMLEQPALLDANADPLFEQARNALPQQRPELVVFAARGSSDNACVYARYLFEARLGIPASLSAPSVITRYKADLRYPRSLVIGVSQSAAAQDVADLLQHARQQGHRTLSITNATEGPVVDAAQERIFLLAGQERAVAATKTFTLTLLAFYQLARAMGADLPTPDLLSPSKTALEHYDARRFAKVLAASKLVFALGRGFHFAAALEAALKLIECALIPCKPFSPADFAHGPLALAGRGAAALSLGADRDDATAQEVRAKLDQTGAQLLQAPTAGELCEELCPIPACIFAQRVAYEAALVKGLNPDEPRHISKVTRTR